MRGSWTSQFSFPSQITQQTSAATYEQNLDLTFNSDGSITLVENLVGPNSTTTTSLGNWATGAGCGRSLIGGGIPFGVDRLGEPVRDPLAGRHFLAWSWVCSARRMRDKRRLAAITNSGIPRRTRALAVPRIQLSTQAGSGLPPGITP